ncbi:MAG: acyltransferase 3 [Verrucomicrobiales bacterium]|nr:acyltransferase 3 [Verrucomicrobiales bacterium]
MSSFSVLQEKLRQKHIPALDGIRVISVFAVICYHFGFAQYPGVTTFFVLSGFLITWLLLSEQERTGTISVSEFYKRRSLRIFPAFYGYWIGTVVLLFVFGKHMAWKPTWAAFFFVSDYYGAINPQDVSAFGHTWSLAIEEQFYLLWPALLWIWRKDLVRMTWGTVCLIACVWIHRALLALVFDVSQSYIYRAFDTRFDNLLVGCLLAILLKRGVGRTFWDFLTRHAVLPLIIFGILMISVRYGGLLMKDYRDVVSYALHSVLIGVIMIQLIALSGSVMWRWLDWAPIRYLGRISYGMYLYQQLVLWPVKKMLLSFPVAVQLAGGIAVTVAIASVSYYVLERPFLKLRGKRKQMPAAVPVSEPASVN